MALFQSPEQADPGTRTAAGALTPVPRRTRAQLQKFLSNLPGCYQSWLRTSSDRHIEQLLASMDGRHALSLAMSLVADPALEARTVNVLIAETHGLGENIGAVLTNSLLIAALLVAEGKLDEDEAAEWVPMADTEQWSAKLVWSVFPHRREP